MRLLLCVVALACLGPQTLLAKWETLVSDYMPHLNGKPWPRVPITAYIETKSNVWVHPTAPLRYPTLREVRDPDADFTTVVMRLPDGSSLKTYNAAVLGPYLAAVYSGDFNGDGIPDFMAIKPGSGCGIAGEYCVGIFAFSSKGNNDYTFTRITTMGLGPQNLVLDPKTKKFRLIHTSLRQPKCLDGRYHTFWVHRFYKWEYGNLELDSALSPIWIQYLERPNHEATRLLSPKLKAKGWSEDPESEARIAW
jgi:hypothetical protein